jgi:hypothetical protein
MNQRIRTIKPELFRHEGLFDLEIETKLPIRVAWMGLFTCSDREGRFPWRPRVLKTMILLAERLTAHRRTCGNPATGSIFANGKAKPLCLDWLYRSCIKDALNRCRVCRQSRSKHGPLVAHEFERDSSLPTWSGWHAFRRGLASNLNRLRVDDSVIQAILRHSTVAVTQRCYIKTVPDDAQAAMKKLSEALACSNCAPNGESGRGTLLQ